MPYTYTAPHCYHYVVHAFTLCTNCVSGLLEDTGSLPIAVRWPALQEAYQYLAAGTSQGFVPKISQLSRSHPSLRNELKINGVHVRCTCSLARSAKWLVQVPHAAHVTALETPSSSNPVVSLTHGSWSQVKLHSIYPGHMYTYTYSMYMYMYTHPINGVFSDQLNHVHGFTSWNLSSVLFWQCSFWLLNLYVHLCLHILYTNSTQQTMSHPLYVLMHYILTCTCNLWVWPSVCVDNREEFWVTGEVKEPDFLLICMWKTSLHEDGNTHVHKHVHVRTCTGLEIQAGRARP